MRLQTDLATAYNNKEMFTTILLIICFLGYMINASISSMLNVYFFKSHFIGLIKFILKKRLEKQKAEEDKKGIPLDDIEENKEADDNKQLIINEKKSKNTKIKKTKKKSAISSSSSSFYPFGNLKLTKAQKRYKKYIKSIKLIPNINTKIACVYLNELTKINNQNLNEEYIKEKILIEQKKFNNMLKFYNKINIVIFSYV